jgi:phospholipid/cholesterol/gamma-HCH transport system substrate-binding protein
MKEQSSNKAKLGVFVLTGTLLLILGLYFIGSKRNIFRSSINVSASFSNVGGLLPGNNVRFNGINVGTISKVYAVSDTAIKVEFTIDEKLTKFINKNAIAAIGTDGLLGNKLINISPGKSPAEAISNGDILFTLRSIQMDNALRTLVATNSNLEAITNNLREVSAKFNSNNSLWRLLADTMLAEDVERAVVRFKFTGENTATLTGDLSKIVKEIKGGKGTFGALLTDTSLLQKLNQTIVTIHSVSDSLAIVSGNFKNISDKIKKGEGAIGTLITDTAFVHNLNQSMTNIKFASGSLNENMEALKYSWPFKKYYKKNKSKETKRVRATR